jgi:hypothetical protein
MSKKKGYGGSPMERPCFEMRKAASVPAFSFERELGRKSSF